MRIGEYPDMVSANAKETGADMSVVVPPEVPEHQFVVPKPRYTLTPEGEVDPRRTAQHAVMANWNM